MRDFCIYVFVLSSLADLKWAGLSHKKNFHQLGFSNICIKVLATVVGLFANVARELLIKSHQSPYYVSDMIKPHPLLKS